MLPTITMAARAKANTNRMSRVNFRAYEILDHIPRGFFCTRYLKWHTSHSLKESLFGDTVRHVSKQDLCTHFIVPEHRQGDMRSPPLSWQLRQVRSIFGYIYYFPFFLLLRFRVYFWVFVFFSYFGQKVVT